MIMYGFFKCHKEIWWQACTENSVANINLMPILPLHPVFQQLIVAFKTNCRNLIHLLQFFKRRAEIMTFCQGLRKRS